MDILNICLWLIKDMYLFKINLFHFILLMLENTLRFQDCINYEKDYKIPKYESIYGLIEVIKTKSPLSNKMLKEIRVTFSYSTFLHKLNIYSIQPVYNKIDYSPVIKIPKRIKQKLDLNNPILYYINKQYINHKKHLQVAVIKPKHLNENPLNTIYSIEIIK